MNETIPDQPDDVRDMVRDHYGKVAASRGATGCCVPVQSSACCPPEAAALPSSEVLGYASEELAAAPADADLGLGCGNPTAIASLSEGETVLDLGSGGGLDAFIAARKVGPSGRVIGVDMTQEMLGLARKNAVAAELQDRVEFREGTIEALPVVDDSVDVIISNCVINLSPDKAAVFREAYRVLKPGGRLAVSDILLDQPLPESVRTLASAYVGCIAGAETAEDYLAHLEAAGFQDVRWTRRSARPMLDGALADPTIATVVDTFGRDRVDAIAATVWSYQIEAVKA